MNIDQLIGGIVAVVIAGMPAMLALLKIRELHVLINSRLTQLIEATAKASHSAGQLEGRDEGRYESEAQAPAIVYEATKVAKTLLAEATKEAKNLLAEAAEKARAIIAEAAERVRTEAMTAQADVSKPARPLLDRLREPN